MFSGGDGVVREIMFRKDLVLSVLSERRVFSPYGLNGKQRSAAGEVSENLRKFASSALSALFQGSQLFCQRVTSELLHNSSRAGHLTSSDCFGTC